MKDIHSHLLYKTDDGPKTLEESIKIFKEIANEGVKEIILTPHYILESIYSRSKLENKKKLNIIKKKLKEEKIDIKIYLGNEVFINDDIPSLVHNKQISTLNDSRYVLIELPVNNKLYNLNNTLFTLLSNNYVPIIAHVERYRLYDNKISELINLVNSGVLFQANLGSLGNRYGKECTKSIKRLLKYNLIHFIGTDIHHSNSVSKISRNIKRLTNIVGKDKAEELLNTNFDKVINNEEIIPEHINKLKLIDSIKEWL